MIILRDLEQSLSLIWRVLLANRGTFCLLQFQDDIGDKSVFMFNALPEEEKRALIEKLEQQKVDSLN